MQIGEFLSRAFRCFQPSVTPFPQKTAGKQRVDHGLGRRLDFVSVAAQEKCFTQPVVVLTNGLHEPLPGHRADFTQQSGNQRRQDEAMQDVVAEISQRYGLSGRDDDHSPAPFDLAKPSGIGDDL